MSAKNLTLKKKQKIPQMLKPQLATLVAEPPIGNNWLHEIKFDGYRLIAFIEQGKIKLMTRGNQNWTAKFPNIKEALAQLNLPNIILDGEIVVLDKDQHSNFQLFQNAIKDGVNTQFIYYIFDLIYYNGYDLSAIALIERKKLLSNILKKNTILRYSNHVIENGAKVFKEACKLSLEGIVSKEINSHYSQKRSRNWLKVKCKHRQEFVIAGYRLPQGQRKHFGSLLLGIYTKNKKFIYCGHVGTGFNKKSLQIIHKELSSYETKQMPFETPPPNSKKVIWVKPTLVAEVEFSDFTTDGILRHPSFKGIRLDKSPKSIRLEKPK